MIAMGVLAARAIPAPPPLILGAVVVSHFLTDQAVYLGGRWLRPRLGRFPAHRAASRVRDRPPGGVSGCPPGAGARAGPAAWPRCMARGLRRRPSSVAAFRGGRSGGSGGPPRRVVGSRLVVCGRSARLAPRPTPDRSWRPGWPLPSSSPSRRDRVAVPRGRQPRTLRGVRRAGRSYPAASATKLRIPYRYNKAVMRSTFDQMRTALASAYPITVLVSPEEERQETLLERSPPPPNRAPAGRRLELRRRLSRSRHRTTHRRPHGGPRVDRGRSARASTSSRTSASSSTIAGLRRGCATPP